MQKIWNATGSTEPWKQKGSPNFLKASICSATLKFGGWLEAHHVLHDCELLEKGSIFMN